MIHDNYSENSKLNEFAYNVNDFFNNINIASISYRVQISALVDFVYDELMSKYSIQQLNIDSETEAKLWGYVNQAKAYLDGDISKGELANERESAWKMCDEFSYERILFWETHTQVQDPSAAEQLAGIIVRLFVR